MTLESTIPKGRHVLWSLSDVYESPKRLSDSREEWAGDLKTKKSREPIVKVNDTFDQKPENSELFERAYSQLKKDSLILAELYVEKPITEIAAKKRSQSSPTSIFTLMTYIMLAAGILGFLFVLNIIRRRK